MKHVITFLFRSALSGVAWLQQWFAPGTLTLPASCDSGACGTASAQAPTMLVASDLRGRVSFFVPDI
jgi:hypothetical protein